MTKLDIFNVKTVTIVGVSREQGKIGNIILSNLLKNFNGRIFLVHPTADQIQGIKCYKNVELLPEPPDLAVVSLPASKAVGAIRSLAIRGCRICIPVAGGFGESGEKGKQLEGEMKDIASQYGVRIIGPNTVGIIVPRIGLNTALTTGEKTQFPSDGHIGFISQSGALGLLSIDEFSNMNVGFSAFLSLGNEVDVDETDALIVLGEDKSTSSISLYLEKLGRVEEFLNQARNISKHKGIVVLKGGQTEAGNRATALHTGSLFRTGFSMKSLFRQYGIIPATDELELMDYSIALSYGKPVFGNRVAVITSAGGVGVTSSDILESHGFRVPKVSESLRIKIAEDIADIGSSANPIDLTAEATDEQYEKVMSNINESDEFDSMLVFVLFQTQGVTENIIGFLQDFNKGNNKPIVVGTIGGRYAMDGLRKMISAGIPTYPSISRSVKALSALRERGLFLRRYMNEHHT
jgi:acyl-CoA synthetase (NDP forming)